MPAIRIGAERAGVNHFLDNILLTDSYFFPNSPRFFAGMRGGRILGEL